MPEITTTTFTLRKKPRLLLFQGMTDNHFCVQLYGDYIREFTIHWLQGIFQLKPCCSAVVFTTIFRALFLTDLESFHLRVGGKQSSSCGFLSCFGGARKHTQPAAGGSVKWLHSRGTDALACPSTPSWTVRRIFILSQTPSHIQHKKILWPTGSKVEGLFGIPPPHAVKGSDNKILTCGQERGSVKEKSEWRNTCLSTTEKLLLAW